MLWRRISGSFFLSLSFSHSEVIIKSIIKWRIQNDKVFTQMRIFSFKPLFWAKKMSLNDFLMTTWEQENESARKKEPEFCVYQTSQQTGFEWRMLFIGTRLAIKINLKIIHGYIKLRLQKIYISIVHSKPSRLHLVVLPSSIFPSCFDEGATIVSFISEKLRC